MRKVLFLIPTLTGGGAERVIVTLLQHLDRSRFQAVLAVVDMRRAAFRTHIPDDVEVIDLQARRVRNALPAIIRLIWQRRPDVVFSTLSHLNLALAIVRPLLPRGVRSVARESCVISENLGHTRSPRLWAWMYRRFYRRHDLVVCQSEDMHQDLVRNFGFPDAQAITINNPVDAQRIREMGQQPAELPVAATGRTVLVAAGRLEPQKGFDLLVDAMALLADPSLQLFVLGEGDAGPALQAQVRAKSLESQVRFVGFQANPYAWIARADAFVLSSRFEGFPNVVLEALACGTPVIATPAPGGVRELLGNRPECVIAEAITAQALAEAIRTWLAGSRRRVPADAVAPYQAKRIVGRYEQVLQ